MWDHGFMKIAILSPSYLDSSSAFQEHDPGTDPSPYLRDHDCTVCMIEKKAAFRQVRDCVGRDYSVFINLCDGSWDEDRPGIEVVQALERFNVPYTGAGPAFYDPSRDAMKRVAYYMGLDAPPGVFARTGSDVDRAAATLRFPLIVKHPNSYGSIGMTRDSRVSDPQSLAAQAGTMIRAYGQALIEEFIEGREFTVLVAEPGAGEQQPRTYVPVECLLPPGETFKHFHLKWVGYDQLSWEPVRETSLDDRLRGAASRFFAGMNGSGYGRCDFRLSPDGRLYLLEINPNCGLFYPKGQFGSADLILDADAGGHRGFLDHILDCAFRRQRRNRRLWSIRFDPGRGYEMVAAQGIPAGGMIMRGEEQAHHLVSRRHVERTWDSLHQQWFRQYAWPLTGELFVTWNPDPEAWAPMNHSCDPNAWMEGLDLVARRGIAAGDAITVDYATFCGETMADFACHCGSPLCRKIIRGTDHLLGLVGERYGDHVSEYVRLAREQNRKCSRPDSGPRGGTHDY